MPVYEYQHKKKSCKLGEFFEIVQSIKDDRLAKCPECGGKIERLISGAYISTPTGISQYRNMGFTRLEKRDEGIYENVTADSGENRIMERGKPETIPDFSKTISD